MRTATFLAALSLTVFGTSATILAQGQSAQPLYPVNSTREQLGEFLASPQPGTPAAPVPTDTAPPAAPGFELLSKFDYTFLPGGGKDGFGTQDVEASARFTIPLGDYAPLRITPGGAVRFWEGPVSGPFFFGPDLPAQVYDLYLDIAWRPRPAEWLFLDLAFTPGLYTDFRNVDSSAFRPRGRALAIVALSEQFQFVLGALYTNRLRTTVLPAGGVIWSPSEDTKFTLVFPAPKVSRRFLTTEDGTKWWGYLAGEFGGGTWAIRREGFDDTVDYSDLRVLAGVEAVRPGGASFHTEVGFAFERRIRTDSGLPAGDFTPNDAFVLRAGLSF
jgi:hypothetical protein